MSRAEAVSQAQDASFLYEIEADLRDVSARIQTNPISDRDIDRVERSRRYVDRAQSVVNEIVSGVNLSFDREVWREAIDAVVADLSACFEKTGSECRPVNSPDPMRRLDEHVAELTGNRCLFGTQDIAIIVSSLASCFHRVADAYSQVEQVSERCYKSKDADPTLVEACKYWNSLIDKQEELGIYTRDDVAPTEGRITDKRLMLRVGSSLGHATHLDLEKGTVEYYDTDMEVNDEMKRLFEKYARLNCQAHGEGVSCDGLTPDNVKQAVKVLSLATSMDIRMNNPEMIPAELREKILRENPEYNRLVSEIEQDRAKLLEMLKELESKAEKLWSKLEPELRKDMEKAVGLR